MQSQTQIESQPSQTIPLIPPRKKRRVEYAWPFTKDRETTLAGLLWAVKHNHMVVGLLHTAPTEEDRKWYQDRIKDIHTDLMTRLHDSVESWFVAEDIIDAQQKFCIPLSQSQLLMKLPVPEEILENPQEFISGILKFSYQCQKYPEDFDYSSFGYIDKFENLGMGGFYENLNLE